MLADIRYLARLFVSVWRRPRPRRGTGVAVPLAAFGLLSLLAVYGYVPAVSALERAHPTAADVLLVRAARAQAALLQAESVYQAEASPIERVLRTYRDDPVLARRVAVALVREGRRTSVPPRLLMAVLLVENPWLDPGARSPVGALGLMQVMPLHRGQWKRCAPRLEDLDSNICHGAQIFAAYVKQSGGNLERALLRYNGCVTGSNTPNCQQYANLVFARAGRASVQAWRRAGGGSMP